MKNQNDKPDSVKPLVKIRTSITATLTLTLDGDDPNPDNEWGLTEEGQNHVKNGLDDMTGFIQFVTEADESPAGYSNAMKRVANVVKSPHITLGEFNTIFNNQAQEVILSVPPELRPTFEQALRQIKKAVNAQMYDNFLGSQKNLKTALEAAANAVLRDHRGEA